MSNRYKGGIISATPPTTSTSSASGAWTLEQQMQAQAAGAWPSPPPPIYIEDVFSTWLYTGTGASRTITNNINLSTKGGMVWIKARSSPYGGQVYDTVRGAGLRIGTYGSFAQQAFTTDGLNAFTSSGFSLGSDSTSIGVNLSGTTFASWTFQEQAKFFDIVTYTGNGAASRNIAHNLGATPGCIINKALSISESWGVYHRSTGANGLYLNATNSAGVTLVPTGHTSTTFEVADGYGLGNSSGVTYVAYLFAHDAGGFPASGTGSENGISCGSYTGDGTTDGSKLVSLGYEPQWVLVKRTDSSTNGGWHMIDVMRGMPTATTSASITALVLANSSAAEVLDSTGGPQATGFSPVASLTNTNGASYIYIAIRRGPMAVPTTGTSVFQPAYGTGSTPGYPSSFTVDGLLNFFLSGSSGNPNLASRLAAPNYNVTSAAVGETNGSPYWKWDFQTGVGSSVFTSSFAGEMFRRAPSFFDVVCFAQTASGNQRNAHNLTVVPELIIAKARNYEDNWYVYNQTTGRNTLAYLNLTHAFGASTNAWGSSNPTATDFGTSNNVLVSGYNYIAYLFATCPGVSKVGTYTGTGALQTINCGFAAGARFVLIKRTDSTGDWYVYDSARGISSGNDPYYLTNSDAAQVTGTNYVDTTGVGFQVTAAAPAGINANGGTFIFLAIA